MKKLHNIEITEGRPLQQWCNDFCCEPGAFSNGPVKGKRSDRIKFGCFEEKEQVKPAGSKKAVQKRKLLVAEANGVRYKGPKSTLISGDNQENTRCMVGVRDKSSGKIKLYESEVFYLRTEFSDDSSEEETPTEKSFMEKSDALTSAFGSSKKKKSMVSRHKNQLKDSALQEVVGSAVSQALEQPGAERLIAPVELQKAASDIPPFNESALRPQDVYTLNSIISEAELESLQSEAQVFVKSTKSIIDEWEKTKKYPLYVINHLRMMPIREEPRTRRACLLLYLCYLIHMFHFSFKDLKRRDPFPSEWNMPGMIKKQLFSSYTIIPEGTKQRVMTARLKDKLLSYVLVLCLIIDEFNLPYTPLLADLKMMDKKFQTFFRALGCKVLSRKVGGEKIPMVTLPIPLTFPDPFKKEKGKKK